MKQSYLITNKKEDCYGCTACENICPVKCITMIEDEEGFIYPAVDEERCIKCNKCKNICIRNDGKLDRYNTNYPEAYIAYNLDKKIRDNSSSGGISNILMEYVIHNKGVVYGVRYDENMDVIHDKANTMQECEKFRYSKYVRSNIRGTYGDIENKLKDNKLVLFIGTPCQVAGLKSYIGKNLQSNLITCDIVCHATPSPKVYRKFIDNIEKKYKGKIKNMNFRSKEFGYNNRAMSIDFEDRRIFLKLNAINEYSNYMQLFGTGISVSPACYECNFANIEKRTADFTIADFYGKTRNAINDNNGISLLLINTEEASSIFNNFLYSKIKFEKTELKKAFENNHISPIVKPLKRDSFFRDIDRLSYDKVINEYVNKYRCKTVVSKYIPKNIKVAIKKVFIKIFKYR